MSIDLIIRLIFLLIFGIIGVFLGDPIGVLTQEIWPANAWPIVVFQILASLIIGFLDFLSVHGSPSNQCYTKAFDQAVSPKALVLV